MAKFLAYYNLFPTNIGVEFLGLSRDAEKGSIINTLGRNMVIITKLADQKQTQSWTLLERLTTKVIFDFKSNNYVGVFMGNYIRRWDFDCIDVNKSKKIKLRKHVSDLVFCEKLKETLVIYNDGYSESIEFAIDNRKNRELDADLEPIIDGSSITDPKIFVLPDGKIMLTYFVQNDLNGENNSIDLIYYLVDEDSLRKVGDINRIRIFRADQNSNLMGFTVVDGLFIPSLITIWSDKRIFMQPLRDQEGNIDLQNNIGQFMSMMPQIKLSTAISVVGISQDFVAIYGASSEQEGAFLVIYNTKFHIVQATQFFKVYFNNSRLWAMDNNIYLGIGQMLSLVPFVILKEQLSDLLGSQRVVGTGNYVDKEYMNEDYELEETLLYEQLGQQNENIVEENEIDFIPPVQSNTSESRYFEYIGDANTKLESLYNFDMLFNVLRDENGLQDSVVSKLHSNALNATYMSEKYEILITELEKCGASEMEICDRIIPILIEADTVQDLKVCLQRYSTISELMIAKSLIFSINKVIDLEINFEEHQKEYALLNQLLACTYDRDELLPHIRSQFDISSTIFLLNYLNEFYKNPECILDELPVHGDSFDSDSHIVEWINVLLDAQYQKLILSSDQNSLNLLVDIQNTINTSINDIRTLSKFLPELHNIANKKKIQTKQNYSKWYTIENISLY